MSSRHRLVIPLLSLLLAITPILAEDTNVIVTCTSSADCPEICLDRRSSNPDDQAKGLCADACPNEDDKKTCPDGFQCLTPWKNNVSMLVCLEEPSFSGNLVIFLDRNMEVLFLVLGIALLLCLPPDMPIVVVVSYLAFSAAKKFFRSVRKYNNYSRLEDVEQSCSDPSDRCSMCGQSYNSDLHRQTYLMKCGHMFGFTCIDMYLRHEAEQCPVCKDRATFLHIFDA